MNGTLGHMLYLADAPSVEGYRVLLRGERLTLTHQHDTSDSITKLVEDINAKLAAFRFLLSLQGQPTGISDLV